MKKERFWVTRLIKYIEFSSKYPVTREYNGYIQFLDKDNKWKYVHRDVAEKKTGRKIPPGYIVHHADGDRKNNDPSNLWVMREEKHIALHEKYSNKKRKGFFRWLQSLKLLL